MSNIILEGPDGAGKTTLGLKLSSKTNRGYYRRRTPFDMEAETFRALEMDDVVLDRSWITDVIYSAKSGRVPALGRTGLYTCGLIAAKNCLLYIKLVNRQISSVDAGEVDQLRRAYLKQHWSEPDTFIVPEKPDDMAFDILCSTIKENEERIMKNPDPHGLGSYSPCLVLVERGWPVRAIMDLMFLSGIKPIEVHIQSKETEKSVDDLAEYFCPKIIVRTPTTFRYFDSHLERFKDSISQKLDRSTAPLDGGYDFQ